MNYLLHAETTYLQKMSLISWEAGQWMQYIGCSYDKKFNILTLSFKSSSYGIGFDIGIQTPISDEHPDVDYIEAYEHFKSLKYKLKPQHK